MTDNTNPYNKNIIEDEEDHSINLQQKQREDEILNDPRYSLDDNTIQTSEGGIESLEEALAFMGTISIEDMICSNEPIKETTNEPIVPELQPDTIEELLPTDFKNPIDFVNYMETVHMQKKLICYEKMFHLKNSTYSKTQARMLQFYPKKILTGRLFKGDNNITSIALLGNQMLSGNSQGIIKRYSCDNEYEHETFKAPEIETSKVKNVLCMHVSKKNDFLASGFANGYVALWDMKTAKCIKMITDLHRDSVMVIKFVKTKKKMYDIITSDLQGYIYRSTITEGYFNTSVESVQLMKTRQPMFLIEILKTTKEERKKYSFCKSEALVVTFGGLEHIIVYQLEPSLKKLYAFERPDYISLNCLPDLSFGIGYPPRPNTTEEEEESDVDFNDVYMLLLISWDNMIFQHIVPVLVKEALPVIFIGHYINSTPIYRMGFLSPSIAYAFDKYQKIKLLNTALFNYGPVDTDPITKRPINKNDIPRAPELEEVSIQDGEIRVQSYVPEMTIKKEGEPQEKSKKYAFEVVKKETYTNTIIGHSKTIVLVGKKSFHYGKLLAWDECLMKLQQNSDWEIAMTIGLEIYHGKLSLFPGLPLNKDERKDIVEKTLKNLVHQFAVTHTGYEIWQLKEKYNEIMINSINLSIEFCIEINQVELLMSEIQELYINKDYGDIFIEKLEPFILCDKIGKEYLDKITISKLIDIYTKKNKLPTLAQILLHLDIETINNTTIKEQCSMNNLITPLIYIYMNGDEEDYFFPIKKIYDIFINCADISFEDFISYPDYFNHNGQVTLESSKPYVGHKLFWYITLCLKGEKYPGKEQISEKTYSDLLLKITLWLLSSPVFDTLLAFDSYSLFSLFAKIFNDEKLISFIEKTPFNKDMVENVWINNTPIENYERTTLVNVIIDHNQFNKNEFILEDFNHFIVKMSVKIPKMKKETVLQAGLYLLSLHELERKNDVKDYFGIHTQLVNKEDLIQRTSSNLIDMLDSRNDFKEEELITFLIKSKPSPFINVTLELLQRVKNYAECLNILLKESIMKKTTKIFDWIDTTFIELQAIDPNEYSKLQGKVLEKTVELAELSNDKLYELIANWFDNNHDIILTTLKAHEKLLLPYLEKHLSYFKEDDIQIEDRNAYEGLLSIHIELLFSLGLYDQILPNLQKRQLYPTESVLFKCKKYNIYDAIFYLFQKIGASEEEMSYFTGILQRTFNSIILSIKQSQPYTDLLKSHSENIGRCIELCEKNSDKSREEDSEKMWFDFIQLFYNLLKDLKKAQGDMPKESYEELTGLLSRNIRQILEKMDSYVSVQKIIDNVTNNYQQAEFKEIKTLLLDVLSSFSHHKNVLACTRNILARSLTKKVSKYERLVNKGTFYHLDHCDECEEDFEDALRRSIILFRCGHKVHTQCGIDKHRDYIRCPICQREDERTNLATKSNEVLFEKHVPSFFKADSVIKSNQERTDKHLLKMKELLRNVDKKYFETSQLFG